MKIYADDDDSIINISVWKHKDGDGEFRPLQTHEPIEEFNISINNEKITVYYNKSKSSVDYFYLKFKGLWHWTRDKNIKNYSQYTASSKF